jgi:hypothetical protein
MKARILLISILLILGMAFYAHAETDVFAINGEPHYEGVIATTTSAAGFATAALYYEDAQGRNRPAKAVLILAQSAGVNFCISGTTPTTVATTDVGMPLNLNSSYVVKGLHAISKFLCINQVASSGAKVKYIVYY